MRIELVKRPEQSKLFSALSPFIALGLTLVAGAVMFSLLGKNPLDALYYYFIDPLREVWSLHELAIKAAPLILIAVGLSVCYLSNNWNIGAEGQFTIGAIVGSILPVLFPQFQNWAVLPLMLIMGMLGGAAYASVPAFLKARFNTNEILTSLMLVYVAQLFLDWLVRGPWRNPEGLNFPETRNFHEYAVLPEIWSASGRANWGFVFALVAAVALWFMLSRTLKGFEVKVLGQSPRAGQVRRVLIGENGVLCVPALRRVGWPGRHLGSLRRHRPAPADDFAGLRLCRDYRRLSRPPQSARHHRGRAGSGTVLPGRRGSTDFDRRLGQGGPCVPGHAFVLRARLRHAHPLPHPLHRDAGQDWGGGSKCLKSILITIATAATPLLIASIGELVVERSGVLNLGVEGMMVMGAVTGFGVALATGSPWLGVLAAILVGALFSLLFGFLTLTLVTNQVATGLALTLLGLGLSGMIGESFVGLPGVKMSYLYIPYLTDIPYVGKLLFGQDPLFYVSILLTAGVAWFLFRTRAGLTLRSIGDNHASAHALGINVIGIRYLAVMFGGACAGLAGAYLSLVYTPQWIENMTAGRGWIALALVVFASWRPWRVLAGAYLFGAVSIGQLARTSAGDRRSLAATFFTPLSGNHRRACSNLAQPATDDGEHTGFSGAAVCARSLITKSMG